MRVNGYKFTDQASMFDVCKLTHTGIHACTHTHTRAHTHPHTCLPGYVWKGNFVIPDNTYFWTGTRGLVLSAIRKMVWTRALGHQKVGMKRLQMSGQCEWMKFCHLTFPASMGRCKVSSTVSSQRFEKIICQNSNVQTSD